MNVIVLQTDNEYKKPLTAGALVQFSSLVLRYPFPLPGGVQSQYLNKCIDGITNQWTFWVTFFQDLDGTEYPGDMFDSATYKIETIVYGREQ